MSRRLELVLGCSAVQIVFAGFLQKSTSSCKTRGHSTVWLLSQNSSSKRSQTLYISLAVDGPAPLPDVTPGLVMPERKCALCTLRNLKSVLKSWLKCLGLFNLNGGMMSLPYWSNNGLKNQNLNGRIFY